MPPKALPLDATTIGFSTMAEAWNSIEVVKRPSGCLVITVEKACPPPLVAESRNDDDSPEVETKTTRRPNPIGVARALKDDLFYQVESTIGPLMLHIPSYGVQSSDDSSSKKEVKSALKGSRSTDSSIKTTRSVSFQSLIVREYDMTLGDHPNAASGPPVTLSWNHKREKELDLEQYERARQPRRNRRQLKMSYKKREELLQENGFSMESIKEAWLNSLEVRRQRYETLMKSVMSTKMEEAWESTCRKFWRVFYIEV